MSGEPDAANAPPARPIFAIFEGGGAKGVAHVGALQAVHDNGIDIVGVAGTSAGALVALMVAIGLEAGDIMSAHDARDHILARHGLTPTALLGERDWSRLQRLRRGGLITAGATLFAGALAALVATPRNSIAILKSVRSLGLFSSAQMSDFINMVVRERLTAISQQAGLDRAVPDRVTFADLDADWPTVVPLKIVATDVEHGSLELFDSHLTPEVVVAEAVAASISIPIVFRPAEIPSFRAGRFADGGLVSNLPLWVFSEEKLAYEREHFSGPPVPIVGFSLREPAAETLAERGANSGALSYLKLLLSATLQGSQATTARFLEDVFVVPLETDLDLLAFDRPWEDYRAARERGRTDADRHLRFMLDAKPDRIRRELVAIRAATLAAINQGRAAKGKEPVDQLRVNLIRPFGRQSLQVVESVGMEADADDRLLLDRRGRGAAESFTSRELRVFRLGPRHNDRSREYMTKYERALVRSTVKTVMCVPIFEDLDAWAKEAAERPEPAGVLAIDSDVALAPEFEDDNLKAMLVSQGAVLYEAVSSEV